MTPIPRKPHDAGSHDQQMTPAVQAVIDAADKRMPAGCTTPDGCRQHGCHGACLPHDMTPAEDPPEDGLDSYGNPTDGSRLINCCYPDCGCPGARLCNAENGPSQCATWLNVEPSRLKGPPSMTPADRELLEAAAKAAQLIFVVINGDGAIEKRRPGILQPYVTWNPLADDGDALRLAVKLEMDILQRRSDPEVWVQAPMQQTVLEPVGSDPLAATRRAVVRAAAAIGKDMT